MNRIIKLFTVAATVALVGCSPGYESMTLPVLPDELKDCKFYYVTDGSVRMRVVRCPLSVTSTTYTSGKTTRTDVVIDGVTYRAVEK